MGRVLRLNKIISYMNVDEDIKASMKLTKIIFFLILYIHLYCCLYWMVADDTQDWWPLSVVNTVDDYTEFYRYSISLQYLLTLKASVTAMLGGDIFPMSFGQTLLGSIGIFLGAIINANIFGELAVILSQIGKPEKRFQSDYAAMNTAMINLDLPEKLRQDIQSSLMSNAQPQQTQIEMRRFFQVISPSLKFKVYLSLYRNILKNNLLLRQTPKLIDEFVFKISLIYTEPEQIIIEQFDSGPKDLYFVGKGYCNVLRKMSVREKFHLGKVEEGRMFGAVEALYKRRPVEQVESQSYTTIGKISEQEAVKVF